MNSLNDFMNVMLLGTAKLVYIGGMANMVVLCVFGT